MKIRHVTFVLAIAAVLIGRTHASAETVKSEAELIGVLKSDAPKSEKAITCKFLAVWGTAKAVPELEKLLLDEELISWARIALEAIPDAAADDALVSALSKVEGRSLIGVVNSLGYRQTVKATDPLSKLLKHSDAQVASAAAASLGKIGTDAALNALRPALTSGPDTVRSAAAEGCVLCAERLLSQGKTDAACQLYDELRQTELPKQRIIEATRGAILCRQADGVPLLIEQLNSNDKDFVGLGLTMARELTGKGVTQALVAALDRVEPKQQARLILSLADRNDATIVPAMLKAAQDGPAPVRIAALEAVQQLGDATCVPDLLEIATDSDGEVAQAATAALETLPGDAVDAALATRLNKASGQEQIILLDLVGRRRIAAVPAVLKAVDHKDAAVRAAALTALGQVVELDHLSVLISRVISPAHAEDAAVALKALQAACIRMPDREATAAKLGDAMADASMPAKITILETLTVMGGTKALQTLDAAAHDPADELQDAATRLLGSWMTVDAGPVLLKLAKDSDGKYKVRALRGYIRLVRQFLMPDDQRVAMCRNALEAAERLDEKRLVLEVVQRYPSVGMLSLAVETTKDAALKDHAKAAALAVAQKVKGSASVAALLKQIGYEPVKIEIIKAEYGAGDKQMDVTKTLRRHVRGFPLITLASTRYNAAFGQDPAPGIVKHLKVQYKINGKPGEAVFDENATILLPMPK